MNVRECICMKEIDRYVCPEYIHRSESIDFSCIEHNTRGRNAYSWTAGTCSS